MRTPPSSRRAKSSRCDVTATPPGATAQRPPRGPPLPEATREQLVRVHREAGDAKRALGELKARGRADDALVPESDDVFSSKRIFTRRSLNCHQVLAALPRGAMTTRSCWGCGTSLCPPKLPSGADAPKFKCTWCLAVNEPAFVFPNRRRSRRARLKTRWRQLEAVFARWGGRVLAVGVVLVSLSVGWAQIAHLAPAVAGDSRVTEASIVAVTLFFLVNVFFNYALCSLRNAGIVEDAPTPAAVRNESRTSRVVVERDDCIPEALSDAPGFDSARRDWRKDGDAIAIPRGAFAGCVPCAPCQAAKPPGAHHCSTCRQCVQAMDHHCPFVANCVGATPCVTSCCSCFTYPSETRSARLVFRRFRDEKRQRERLTFVLRRARFETKLRLGMERRRGRDAL